jgi:hypothetical protein
MAVVQAPAPAASRQPLQIIGEQNAGYAQQQQASPFGDLPILVHANEQKALKSEVSLLQHSLEHVALTTASAEHALASLCSLL